MNLKWMTGFILALCVQLVQGLSVHFKIPKPIYVALGRELVLDASIEKTTEEKIFMVTWERISDKGARRLATYPGKTQDPKISMEREGSTLRIAGVQESDFGRYTITVTNQNGIQTSDEKDVGKHEKPPEASVVLLCDVSREEAQWDSPVFTWLVDGVELTNQTANMSDGGSKLHLQGMKGNNYTCISNSSLGTSVSHFIIPDSTEGPDGCPSCPIRTVIVSLVIVLAVIGLFLFLRRNRLLSYTPPRGRNNNNLSS
ncbi:uncharacterized protein LOC105901619 [Clupea harengus]|uniref:Uncharacterized protein LOC105901619 n=1 Tax=Clupea harengus TaxID=7950 RepID=A0A6P8FUS8_CLUHA|nr:uncharacterized protein LOC105901619 [Clupea harengus]XP_031431758.1 uncharacterized protein LOC105901619 [Clupea harengus]